MIRKLMNGDSCRETLQLVLNPQHGRAVLDHSVLQKNHARDVNTIQLWLLISDPFSFPGPVRLAEAVPRIGDCKPSDCADTLIQ